MKHLKIDNIDYVLSRERDPAELVEVQTGRLLFIPRERLKELEQHKRHQPMLPGMLPFAERPVSFIDQLRERRIQAIRDNVKKRAKNAPRESKPKGVEGIISGFSPEQQQNILKALSKGRRRKAS